MFCVDMQVNDDAGPEEVYEDEDDENDENNWRNDYPEEDEFLPEEDGEKGTPVINAVCFPAVHGSPLYMLSLKKLN